MKIKKGWLISLIIAFYMFEILITTQPLLTANGMEMDLSITNLLFYISIIVWAISVILALINLICSFLIIPKPLLLDQPNPFRTLFVIKLVLLPAYLFHLLLSFSVIFVSAFVFTFSTGPLILAIVPIMFFASMTYGILIVLPTVSYVIILIIKYARTGKISKGKATLYILCQIFLIADIISIGLLKKRFKKEQLSHLSEFKHLS